MLAHLIKKEFLDSLLNQRFIALALFSIILMPLSGFINYKYYDARKASYDNQIAEFLDQSEDVESAMRAYRTPALLSSLARGTEPYMPIFFQFRSVSEGGFQDITIPGNIEAREFSILSTFGSFDLLFLVQVVFSLLAILLAFDMVAGEKERGTLKAILANRVPRDNILLGKLIGGFAVLWVTFLIGFLLLYLVLSVFNGQFLSAATLPRVLLIFGSSTLFLAGFYCIGLMVSTFCHSTRTAIVVLLVAWVVMQLVIPKAGEMIATVVKPVRSEYDVQVERQRIIEEEVGTMEEEAGRIYLQVTGKTTLQFGNLREDEEAWELFKVRYRERYKEFKQRQLDRLNAVTQAWEREKEAQRNLGNAIALFSPAAALSFLISDAAGTGDLAYQQYRDAVADQYQIVDREVFSRQESNRFSIRTEGMMMTSSFDDEQPTLEAVPPFTVSQPRMGTVIAANIWPMGTLFFYLIIPFLVAYTRFLVYDVR